MKLIFIILGSLSLTFGVIGIIIPGLPTTPFILLSGYFYFKSSDKLYHWLLSQKIAGKYLRDYHEKKAFSKKTIVSAVILMWIMISASTIFLIRNNEIRIIIFFIGIIGTFVMLSLKTYNDKNDCE
jgi:uncharacterized membrane protein YbaN (DUF454 family)